ncbi:MAG: ATP-binding protein [Cyclobacteriaceae bacterium]|nr:ATP-binding protein [Cyclobacteriaceae bacterium]
MKISRAILPQIREYIGLNKVLVITGARRVGKTHLLGELVDNYEGNLVHLNGDLPETAQLLGAKNVSSYKRLIGNAKLLVIDEAQVIPDIGKILKIIIDHFKQLTIIATGSSSFDLVNKTGEPLTGRQVQFHLYPVAQLELTVHEPFLDTVQNLAGRLVFGAYPEALNLSSDREKKEYLEEITTSYLLKDILLYEQVKNSHKMLQLLQLISYQVGQEVSNDELGKQLGLKRDTIARYLDLFSKIFVIYRLNGYSSNLRKEVVKSSKWYFVDNGIRNAIINNFNNLSARNDVGQLWENYLMSERIKRNVYNRLTVRPHFWRTYDRQEIDLVEEANGKLAAFEFKWRKEKTKAPIFFTKNYPQASFEVITKENYLDFID